MKAKRVFISFYRKHRNILWILLIVVILLFLFELRNQYKRFKIRRKVENELNLKKVNEILLFEEFELLKKSYHFKPEKYELKLCNQIPNGLLGPINVSQSLPFDFWATSNYRKGFAKNLKFGGSFKPSNCRARYRVAIVVPYKTRLFNLNYFLYHLHPILQRQQLEYRIFVVEQYNDELFNKGVLNNAAFLEIYNMYNLTINLDNLTNYPFDCIIYHDVDLLPEDDRIMYSCPYKKPRHLSVAIDKFDYHMFYESLIGGVINFKVSHYVKVNGYSNNYWGGEDDDMEIRLRQTNLGYERPHIKLARYKMLKHKQGSLNQKRHELLYRATNRYINDGLKNVKYRHVALKKYRMFTHILIDVGNQYQNMSFINASNSVTYLSDIESITAEKVSFTSRTTIETSLNNVSSRNIN